MPRMADRVDGVARRLNMELGRPVMTMYLSLIRMSACPVVGWTGYLDTEFRRPSKLV